MQVDDNRVTSVSKAAAQELVSKMGYLLFYDVSSAASPDSKRLKAAVSGAQHHSVSAAAVQGVRRNLTPAGDSVPRTLPAPAAQPSSSRQATATSAKTSKDKLIDDIIKRKKSPQFANMPMTSCLDYLKIFNVTPVADKGGGVKKVRGQLFKIVAEEIARVEPSLDRVNATLQRVGIPLLKTAPQPSSCQFTDIFIHIFPDKIET